MNIPRNRPSVGRVFTSQQLRFLLSGPQPPCSFALCANRQMRAWVASGEVDLSGFPRGRSATPTTVEPRIQDPGSAPIARRDRARDAMSELYLSDVSRKDKPWDKNRGFADLVRNLYSEKLYQRYADRITACAQHLIFVLSATDDGERELRLQEAHFCRVRHCPVCQSRRASMWVGRFKRAIPSIVADYPTAKFIFLTLTVRNCQTIELRSTLAMMNKAFNRLVDLKAWPALGYVKSVEVTPGRVSGGTDFDFSYCHPHFHVFMMVPSGYFAGHSYIKQDRWVELWKKCLRVDYDPIVDVRKVGGRKRKKALNDDQLSPFAVIDAIKETLKYTVKGEHLILDANWLVELTGQLHKTRAVSVGGVLKKYISESDPDNDDLIHADDDSDDEILPDDPKWLFSWREMEKRYRGGQLD